MRMRRKPLNRRAVLPAQHRMKLALGGNALIVAVAAGVIVRPVDVRGLPIVTLTAARIGIDIAAVKEMRRSHSSDRADRRTEILMIARDDEATPALPKASDGPTFPVNEPAARVDREQPQLIER